jgi:hypothetical protein
MRTVFLIVFGVLSAGMARGAGLDALGYLAFGDVRGHLEPCGCDPATDLGGMRRLAEVVQRERRNDSSLGSFCTGNIVAPKDEGPLKTPFLLEAAAAVPVDACLFNSLEFERAKEVAAAKKKPPFVLSNFKGDKKLPFIRERIETGGFAVFGYMSPQQQLTGLTAVSPALLKKWGAEGKGKAKILLFSGSDVELKLIEGAGVFDAIVSSNTAPMATIVGTQEKDDESRLKRGGVMMVPLGAEGVLRGGKARFEQAKSIGELLQGKAEAPKPILAGEKLVTWLDTSYQNETSLKDLFERYNAAARAQFVGAAAERTKDLASSPFAGEQACVSCHPKAAATWSQSKHAHAMADLAAKKKDEDPECVACHAMGLKEKGGFVSMAASPQFANVQCEVCHGARLAHSKDPTVKPQLAVAPSAVCTSCHNAQHSPAFKQDEYWKKIAHGKEGA